MTATVVESVDHMCLPPPKKGTVQNLDSGLDRGLDSGLNNGLDI